MLPRTAEKEARKKQKEEEDEEARQQKGLVSESDLDGGMVAVAGPLPGSSL